MRYNSDTDRDFGVSRRFGAQSSGTIEARRTAVGPSVDSCRDQNGRGH